MYNIWYRQEFEWAMPKTEILPYAFDTREEAKEYIKKHLTVHSIRRAAVIEFERE